MWAARANVCLRMALHKNQTLLLTAENLWCSPENSPGFWWIFCQLGLNVPDSCSVADWGKCGSTWAKRVLWCVQPLHPDMCKRNFCMWMLANHTPNQSGPCTWNFILVLNRVMLKPVFSQTLSKANGVGFSWILICSLCMQSAVFWKNLAWFPQFDLFHATTFKRQQWIPFL